MGAEAGVRRRGVPGETTGGRDEEGPGVIGGPAGELWKRELSGSEAGTMSKESEARSGSGAGSGSGAVVSRVAGGDRETGDGVIAVKRESKRTE